MNKGLEACSYFTDPMLRTSTLTLQIRSYIGRYFRLLGRENQSFPVQEVCLYDMSTLPYDLTTFN